MTKIRYLGLEQASDDLILQRAQQEGAVFLTRNRRDFADPSRFPPKQFKGVIILQTDREDHKERLERVHKQLQVLLKQHANLAGKTVIVTRTRHEVFTSQGTKKKKRKKARGRNRSTTGQSTISRGR